MSARSLDQGFQPECRVMSACVLVVLLALLLSTAAGDCLAGPRFPAETVRLDIGEDAFTVEGVYLFLHRDARGSFPVLYPFPTDTTLGEPQVEGLWITGDGETEKEVEFVRRQDGLLFWLSFETMDTCRVRIAYRQAILGNRAVYPLARTIEWGEPLSSAEFVVTLPEGDMRPTFNYPFVPAGPADQRRTYLLRKTSFMPQEDLVIDWGSAQGGGDETTTRN